MLAYRSIAPISSSAVKTANAVTPIPGDSTGAMLSNGKARREVLLPSQEGKKNAMQYAL